MQIGSDGTRVPGEVQVDIAYGPIVVTVLFSVTDREEVLRVINAGFDEAEEVMSNGNNGSEEGRQSGGRSVPAESVGTG